MPCAPSITIIMVNSGLRSATSSALGNSLGFREPSLDPKRQYPLPWTNPSPRLYFYGNLFDNTTHRRTGKKNLQHRLSTSSYPSFLSLGSPALSVFSTRVPSLIFNPSVFFRFYLHIHPTSHYFWYSHVAKEEMISVPPCNHHGIDQIVR